jgi:hypothetical protein
LLLLFSFLSWTWTPMAQSHHTVFFYLASPHQLPQLSHVGCKDTL